MLGRDLPTTEKYPQLFTNYKQQFNSYGDEISDAKIKS
jgi:hypothetical protein